MKYDVIVSARAQKELEIAYQWLLERTPQHAPLWHDGMLDAMYSLAENPARYPIIQGGRDLPKESRQLLYGDKHHAYRILFVIRGEQVLIASIRHAARRP